MSRPLIVLATLVALGSPTSFGAETVLAWSSPYAGEQQTDGRGGVDGAGTSRGSSWTGPRPGWEDPMGFATGVAGPDRTAPDWAAPDWIGGDAGGVPRVSRPSYGASPGNPYSTELPPQAPADWFDQFPTGTYRPMDEVPRATNDPRGFRFRPGVESADDRRGTAQPPRFEGYGYSESPASAYPSYRFRGDPSPQQGNWRSPSYDALYRFRPLNDQELGRMDQGSGWRPTERGRDRERRSATRRGGEWGPGEAFGFEPRDYGPR